MILDDYLHEVVNFHSSITNKEHEKLAGMLSRGELKLQNVFRCRESRTDSLLCADFSVDGQLYKVIARQVNNRTADYVYYVCADKITPPTPVSQERLITMEL